VAEKPKGAQGRPQHKEPAQVTPEPVVEEPRAPQAALPFPIVGIGASAGGLGPYSQLLGALPADTGMGFVLIQHLDPTHPSMLREILSRQTPMPVAEVTDEMAVQPNHVYVIPPGVTMGIEGGILRLSPRTEVRGQHRPIDHFFESLAEDQRHKAIGVILSGSATDGTLGVEAIKAEGGITFAQDATAQHTSMPESAVGAGCVDFVLPPARIAQEIVRISRHPYVASGVDEALPVRLPLKPILDHLRTATGVDFTHYKRHTLYRRIVRRAVLHKLEGLDEYATILRNNPDETAALYQDALIGVTSFFRNPEAFEVLKSRIFPKLTQDRSRHEPMRIWSLGCSTGEEAYSLAMAYTEFVEGSGLQIPLQMFATDLNGSSVEKARAGLYSKTIVQDVSPERLRRFFVETDGAYRVSKAIRDTVVFARHNVLTDPPFSRMDLISCRNLIIYLEPPLQIKAVGVMHYALKPQGALWMGSSEALGSLHDLFDVEDAKHRIYVKKPGPPRPLMIAVPGDRRVERHGGNQQRQEGRAPALDIHREADRILLTRYAPASVLVNADLDVLQYRGETGPYLAPSPGKATLNLLKMLREGLLVGVRGALHKARRNDSQVREEGLRVRSNGGYRHVNVHVIPVRGSHAGAEQHYLVLFEEAAPARARPGTSGQRKAGTAGGAGRRAQQATEREAARATTQELAATREYLHSVIEQQEAANEELQRSNEEAQSANEELQSINEELETSREEIQSSNEELATVNEELHNRNVELSQSTDDFANLLASVQLAIVMLGPDLRIRKFTPMAEKMFNLIASDVGRPFTDIHLAVDAPDPKQMLSGVMDTGSATECEVRDREGRWYILRVRPYRTVGGRIDGVVLVLIDVDALKRGQELLRRQTDLLEQTHAAIFMWDLDGGITYWNRGAEESYGFTRKEALGRKCHELLATSPPASAFLEALKRDGHWTGELTRLGRDGQPVVVDSRMVVERATDRRPLVFETNDVITDRKRMEVTLRQRADELLAADRNKDVFLAMLAHELRNPLAPLSNALEILKQPGAPPAMAERAMDVMGRQIHNMARMVDDLLDVSRMTHGRIQLRKEPVDLLTIVDRAVEASQHHIDERGQILTLSLPAGSVYLEADVVRLEQILSNLLNNASKFSPRSGQIWLTVDPHSGSTGLVVIRVRDNGIGIAPENVSLVFNLFMQADSTLNRTTGGLGIGLTLVQHLVELHGGTIEARSPGLGQGSEFVVSLPGLATAPRQAREVSSAEGSDPAFGRPGHTSGR